jgi:hypothetical protein
MIDLTPLTWALVWLGLAVLMLRALALDESGCPGCGCRREDRHHRDCHFKQ